MQTNKTKIITMNTCPLPPSTPLTSVTVVSQINLTSDITQLQHTCRYLVMYICNEWTGKHLVNKIDAELRWSKHELLKSVQTHQKYLKAQGWRKNERESESESDPGIHHITDDHLIERRQTHTYAAKKLDGWIMDLLHLSNKIIFPIYVCLSFVLS